MKLPVQKPSILVVDDTPANIDVLKETLKGDYVIRPALNGALALKIAATEPGPDLILLDVMMPGMDGYEVLRRLQANENTRGIPVIFVTAISEMEGELKGLELGAVDYITKPINPPIVKARVHAHLALREAKVKLEQQNRALLHERELVEDIIARMRASRYFDDRYLRYLVSPVSRSNGDILLASFAPDGRQWVLAGDFTGHGLPAAVAAPLVSHVFYSGSQGGGSVEAVLEEINAVMYRQLPANVFMACCLAEISADRRMLKLWNAGMPQCVLLRDGKVQARAGSQSVPLGVVGQIDVRGGQASFEVGEGSRLYMYSDGVAEAGNPEGELFGNARVEEFLCRTAAGTCVPEDLLKLLEAHRGGASFDDDITLVEIQF
ncbi:MAG: SpoIIE family protein phosphatase [Nitrosomonadales bacterium]|nr:SpoIIE family protein phosphatase [Nitrosomonadales bacterium]